MNKFLISGLSSSGPNVDTDGSEEITTASDTDTTRSDSVEVTDMSYDISEGSDKNDISGKTETIHLCYSSSDDSSLSMPKAHISKHQKPYFNNPAPEMTKYPLPARNKNQTPNTHKIQYYGQISATYSQPAD